MRLQIALGLGLVGVCAGHADEKVPFLTAGSVVYSNVTVTKVTATDVFFMHARGVGNAKLKDLDPHSQKRFRYDPDKAAAVAKQQTEASSQYYQAVAAQKPPVRNPEPEPKPEPVAPPLDRGDMRAPNIRAKSFLGQPAPKFVVEKWLTPAPNTAGKFVVIDFWATWCGPCRTSIPELNRYHARFKDQLVIIGLSGETEAEVRRMKSPKIDYAVAIDTSDRMSNEAGVQAIPHAILLDPNGIVRFEGNPGYLTEKGLENLLAKNAK